MESKTCNGCGELKPLSEFYRKKRSPTGFNPRCKSCIAKTPAQREADRERSRRWRVENRERHEANVQAYRKRHPQRRAARNAVYNAIKRGEMTKQPCEACGDENSQAHHDDYARPLDVKWLCQRHHAERDVELRNNA